MEIRILIRERRKELKLTFKQLKQKCGIDESTLCQFENGKKDIRISSLLRLTESLGLTVNIDKK